MTNYVAIWRKRLVYIGTEDKPRDDGRPLRWDEGRKSKTSVMKTVTRNG